METLWGPFWDALLGALAAYMLVGWLVWWLDKALGNRPHLLFWPFWPVLMLVWVISDTGKEDK